ncbi:MAG TPA: regulatory iron-sulfur-containing complex subunit RicT [Anaerolineaceae bacterium]|nr:regulatory iron-sulfur-containing complex subunit RicT [Anaerolineaceae bacterium]HPN52967.1 regulatory iron-sulfur-containing complex subunit RicT [Anaerolineaceae bacterium]
MTNESSASNNGAAIQPWVVGVRFSKVGKIYHFDARNVPDITAGDFVVVETARGWQLGQVAEVLRDSNVVPEGGLKPVDRRATPRDLVIRQSWQCREEGVVAECQKRSRDLKLQGVKIIQAEYSFDGSRLTIMFSTETEEKVELKSLRQDMQRQYAPAQVELRQIGPRDVAKLLGGMGACGLENRCCSRFLTDFSSISIRMAKEQDISLTPNEITGMCGRLRCCLIYEYDFYVEARSQLPKRNKRVMTPQGEGKVLDVYPLRGAILVDIPDVGAREFAKGEFSLADENARPADKPEKTEKDEPPASETQAAAPETRRPDNRRDIRREPRNDQRNEQSGEQRGGRPDRRQQGQDGQNPRPAHAHRPVQDGPNPNQKPMHRPAQHGGQKPSPRPQQQGQQPEQRQRPPQQPNQGGEDRPRSDQPRRKK